jgi:hypothetical protein
MEALSIIKVHDANRYRRLAQDLDRILVQTTAPSYIASFKPRIWTCMLDEEFVGHSDTTTEIVAAAIVHEATHARLFRCGIGYKESLRARVEAVCFRREIAFAAKLPDGAVVREQAERSLTHYADPAHWTDAAFDARDLTEIPEALRQLGVPQWVVRVLLGLRALRRRLRRKSQ